MTNKTCSLFAAVLLLASGLLVACGALTSTPTPPPDRVTLQLNWSHEAEFAGYYVAGAKGYYASENIAVTIREGSFPAGVDIPKTFLSRSADLTVLGFSEYQIVAQSEAQPVAVMAALQIPPSVLFALSSSGIREPRDMVGRRVAIKNEGWRSMVRETLTNAGIDPARIVEVDVKSDAMAMLYNGEVDVWTGYAHDEPVEARLAGYDLNLIFVGDYGVGAYEGLLVVHQDYLEQNHNLVARFVRASLRGWRYAVEHPDETAEIVARWQPHDSLEFHRLALRALIPLVDTPHAPIGWIDAERWRVALGKAYNPARPGHTIEFVKAAEKK